MKILIVGSGGREHALLWRLHRDAPGADFFFTGENAGMEEEADPVDLEPADVAGLLAFARKHGVDLTVVGPEAPLAAGIADAFAEARVRVFGPRRGAAEIESSKAFAKAFMRRHEIPTAGFRTFTEADAADAYLAAGEGPIVVKASGLLGGKGAVVCETRAEARKVANAMLRAGAFGEAGREVVIEERLEGRELSVIALTDGVEIRSLLPARDHKRALDGDRGPNTGGMGAIAPVPDVTLELLEEVGETILRPALRGLAAEGRSFRGALYAGLMLTREGPSVVEFNARFGDPETQVLLPLLEGSLLDLVRSCAEPAATDVRLAELQPSWAAGAACCVVAASKGYPDAYEQGLPIDLGEAGPMAYAGRGRDEAVGTGGRTSGSLRHERAIVFHAATARREGHLVTAGGRVLGVTGLGPDAVSARQAAYDRLREISFAGMHHRTDIGLAEGHASRTTPARASARA
jgi:phosphoribosylamine---glycine ligase